MSSRRDYTKGIIKIIHTIWYFTKQIQEIAPCPFISPIRIETFLPDDPVSATIMEKPNVDMVNTWWSICIWSVGVSPGVWLPVTLIHHPAPTLSSCPVTKVPMKSWGITPHLSPRHSAAFLSQNLIIQLLISSFFLSVCFKIGNFCLPSCWLIFFLFYFYRLACCAHATPYISKEAP